MSYHNKTRGLSVICKLRSQSVPRWCPYTCFTTETGRVTVRLCLILNPPQYCCISLPPFIHAYTGVSLQSTQRIIYLRGVQNARIQWSSCGAGAMQYTIVSVPLGTVHYLNHEIYFTAPWQVRKVATWFEVCPLCIWVTLVHLFLASLWQCRLIKYLVSNKMVCQVIAPQN